MPAVIPIIMVASVALTAASMKKQNDAARASGQLATDTATYNANIDIAQAQQMDLDTNANIRTARAEDAVYVSRQKTAYAAAGVLSSGSPLAVMATTVGRFEQRIQQSYVDSQQKQQRLYNEAKVGRLYGDAQASAIKTSNDAAMLRGGAQLLSTAYGAYNSGMFASAGGGTGAVSPSLF